MCQRTLEGSGSMLPQNIFFVVLTLKCQFRRHLGPIHSTHNIVVDTVFYCNSFIIIIMIIYNNNNIRERPNIRIITRDSTESESIVTQNVIHQHPSAMFKC